MFGSNQVGGSNSSKKITVLIYFEDRANRIFWWCKRIRRIKNDFKVFGLSIEENKFNVNQDGENLGGVEEIPGGKSVFSFGMVTRPIGGMGNAHSQQSCQ